MERVIPFLPAKIIFFRASSQNLQAVVLYIVQFWAWRYKTHVP